MRSQAEATNLLATYSPARQARFAQFPERCVTGKAPTLAVVRKEYGAQTARDWLLLEINDYNNFVGVAEDRKNGVEQMLELAEMIMARFFYLKMSEIMLFFFKLKCGDYGKIFGSVNCVDIMRALNSFMRERNAIETRVESEQRARERAEHKKRAMNWEQWQERKKELENAE